MAISNEFIEYVLEQLRLVPGVVARRMFGGAGLSVRAQMFGLINDDVLYLKVDDLNRRDYEAAGMKPFAPNPAKPSYVMPYWEVPGEVLEDPEQLASWSRHAIAVAGRAALKLAAKKRPAKKTAAVKKAFAKKAAAKKSTAKKP